MAIVELMLSQEKKTEIETLINPVSARYLVCLTIRVMALNVIEQAKSTILTYIKAFDMI